jgi:hypothetical protein
MLSKGIYARERRRKLNVGEMTNEKGVEARKKTANGGNEKKNGSRKKGSRKRQGRKDRTVWEVRRKRTNDVQTEVTGERRKVGRE